jgi:hypothetical protein
MTTFAEPFTIAPLAPLAQAPAAASDSGPLVPSSPVGSDWSAKRRDGEAKVRQERRSAIERARHSAEAGWSRPGQLTKAERLAAAKSKGTRDTGSEEERRAARGSVQRAMQKVLGVSSEQMPESGISSDKELADPDTQLAIEKLRHNYPGKSLTEIIAQAEHFDAAMRDDPVTGRQTLLEHYAAQAPGNFAEFKPAERVEGTRGSLQRARQAQIDADELRAAKAKYGVNLPKILQQLERFDKDLRENPGLVSARIATSQGAPATERQIEPYKAARAQIDAAKAHQARHDAIQRGVNEAIKTGHIPGDEAHLTEIAAVLQHPKFQHSPNGLDTLKRAAQIVAHPDHQWTTGKRAKRSGGSDAGSKSISGSAPSNGHDAPRGAGSVRVAVDRAMGR